MIKTEKPFNRHVIWFRTDLRVRDNRALAASCEDPHASVVAVFTAPLSQWDEHDVSPRQTAFVHGHLRLLAKNLAGLGIPLVCHVCGSYREAARFVVDFCAREHASGLYFNNQYELNEQRRDRWVEDNLSVETRVHRFDDSLLLPPGSVCNREANMFRVFTPFKRAFMERLVGQDSRCLPMPERREGQAEATRIPSSFFPHEKFTPDAHFPCGEEAALELLDRFCQDRIGDYAHDRDKPYIEGTSRISPYLTTGVLSPRQCLNALLSRSPGALHGFRDGASVWMGELVWREFYHHLIAAFPDLCRHKPFIGWTDRIVWNGSEEDFRAWTEGRTGYPIVDAAMRQLKGTGWMHNRLRMIAAGFLVKDLLIDWRKGEKYFMSKLIDGNLASNNGGWQWSASTGTDAAPWFRIFNPRTQGKKFDPLGRFVREWVPELDRVPDSEIHTPHAWAEKQGETLDYPLPVVDHQRSREMTLEVFRSAQNAK